MRKFVIIIVTLLALFIFIRDYSFSDQQSLLGSAVPNPEIKAELIP